MATSQLHKNRTSLWEFDGSKLTQAQIDAYNASYVGGNRHYKFPPAPEVHTLWEINSEEDGGFLNTKPELMDLGSTYDGQDIGGAFKMTYRHDASPGASRPWCQMWLSKRKNDQRNPDIVGNNQNDVSGEVTILKYRTKYILEWEALYPTDWDTWWQTPNQDTAQAILDVVVEGAFTFSHFYSTSSNRPYIGITIRYHLDGEEKSEALATTLYDSTSSVSDLGYSDSLKKSGSTMWMDTAGGNLGRWIPFRVEFTLCPFMQKGSCVAYMDGVQVHSVTNRRFGVWFGRQKTNTASPPAGIERIHEQTGPLIEHYNRRWSKNKIGTTWWYYRNIKLSSESVDQPTYASPLSTHYPSNPTPDYFTLKFSGINSALDWQWNSRIFLVNQGDTDIAKYGFVNRGRSNSNGYSESYFPNHSSGNSEIILSLGTSGSYSEFKITVQLNGSIAATYEHSGEPSLPALPLSESGLVVGVTSSPNSNFNSSVVEVRQGEVG